MMRGNTLQYRSIRYWCWPGAFLVLSRCAFSLMVWWLSFLGPVLPGSYVLGSGVFGGAGFE